MIDRLHTDSPHEHNAVVIGARTSSPFRLHAIFLFTVVAFMGLGTWANYYGVYRHDQYQLINLGQVVYDGGTLYVDCWENKPPGVPRLLAFVLFISGGSQDAAWLFPGILGLLGLTILYASLGATFGYLEGLIVSVIACVMFSIRAFDAPSNHPDFYAAMFTLSGTSIFLVSLVKAKQARWTSALIGCCWALAALCRQTGLTGPVILSIAAFTHEFRNTTSTHDRRLTVRAWITCAAILVAAIGMLAWNGSLQEAYRAIFSFNAGLLTPQNWLTGFQGLPKLIPVWTPLGIPLILAIISVYRTLREKKGTLNRHLVVGCVLWFMLDNLLSLLGPSQIDRYWMSTWTPLLILACDGLNTLIRQLASLPLRRRSLGLAVCAVLTVALAIPLVERQVNGRYYDGLLCSATQYMAQSKLLTERGTLRALGDRIQSLVPATEQVFVLKYDPGIYLYAHRRCAVRLTYPRGLEQQREIVESLEKTPPFLVLVPDTLNPDAEWIMPIDLSDRLREILKRYHCPGSYLEYHFLVRTSVPDEDESQ